jgi:DNA-binding NarL/FixJ family response regulator
MSGQDHRAADSHFTKWMENVTPLEENPEIVQLSAARSRAAEEAGAAVARQLNGPLTALLLYMNEIKQHSHQLSQGSGNRLYLQQVVENALQQTERVCALVKQMSDNHPASDAVRKQGSEGQAGHSADGARRPGLMLTPGAGQKPLTRREREVLSLMTSGLANTQIAAALRLGEGTVRNHVSNILAKLGVTDRTKAVLVALRQRLV